ncbi:MAG: hypothetical protein ACLP59_20330 [Bryobacteraceae bacterium]
MERCQHLNWNGQFFDTDWGPTDPAPSGRVYWCQHTHNCLGPDGQAVDAGECNPARECYRPL